MTGPFAALALVLTLVTTFVAARNQAFTYVPVDGRTMRLLIAGEGPVTVVFENGLGPPLEAWGKVQPAVSRFARTVSYDRAGVGLSDEGPLPRHGRRIAAELHDALRAAGVAPPYVLVGASLGGPYIRIFAGMFPHEVAGLVLVDPTPDREPPNDTSGLPELRALPSTLEQARASRLSPKLPVLLIDALSHDHVPFATAAIRALRRSNRADIEADTVEYRMWLRGVPGGRLITTSRSGHNVAQEQPELVVETVRQLLAELARPAAVSGNLPSIDRLRRFPL